MSNITAYLKLFRLPGLGGLSIPAVIGALTVIHNLDYYNIFILFIIGSLSSIYGFLLNDYTDIELDKLVKELQDKPLVRGIISKKTALIISIFCILFLFLFVFVLWYGKNLDYYKFAAMICIVLAGISSSIYNLYGKKFVGSDFFVSISVSLMFLFAALSFGEPTLFTWVIFILTFNNILHMNAIEGGIKDADHDYVLGVKNIALRLGVKVNEKKIFIPNNFKFLSIGIRLFSSFLLFIPFLLYQTNFYMWQIIILILTVVCMLFFSYKFLSIKNFERNKIRKYITIQSFLRYSLIPIMLISTIGIFYSTFLIIFPILWYIIFTFLIGEKIMRPGI